MSALLAAYAVDAAPAPQPHLHHEQPQQHPAHKVLVGLQELVLEADELDAERDVVQRDEEEHLAEPNVHERDGVDDPVTRADRALRPPRVHSAAHVRLDRRAKGDQDAKRRVRAAHARRAEGERERSARHRAGGTEALQPRVHHHPPRAVAEVPRHHDAEEHAQAPAHDHETAVHALRPLQVCRVGRHAAAAVEADTERAARLVRRQPREALAAVREHHLRLQVGVDDRVRGVARVEQAPEDHDRGAANDLHRRAWQQALPHVGGHATDAARIQVELRHHAIEGLPDHRVRAQHAPERGDPECDPGNPPYFKPEEDGALLRVAVLKPPPHLGVATERQCKGKRGRRQVADVYMSVKPPRHRARPMWRKRHKHQRRQRAQGDGAGSTGGAARP
mmetsp:Transcript_7964/g.28401  ORF Transcript_7964/g.28401 Transcript_7964/m.28401 type:complete len:392 (+) Transcript_7964:1011-2186(+)